MGFMPLLGAGLIGPSGAPVESFQSVKTVALNASYTAAITIVEVIQAAALAVPPGSVTKFKLMIDGPISGCYIGIQATSGDVYDAQSLTPVLFSGAPNLSQAGGSLTLSDEVSLAWDKTSNLIISMYFNNVNYRYRGSLAAGFATVYHTTAANTAAVADKPSGYATIANALYGVTEIHTNGF